MGVAPELIDGERFVRAWKRFRERFPEDELSDDHRDMLQQYFQTAVFYHDKALHLRGGGAERAFISTLEAISAEATMLIETKCAAGSTSQYRVPRSSDILKRRKQLATSAADAASTAAIETPPLELPHSAPETPTEIDPVDSQEESKPAMMDFNYDDLKSMMESKEISDKDLSTQEIRRRLGLLNRDNANQTSTSESIAQEEQESIQADMVNLARTLKDRTQQINQTLVDDVKILDAVGQSAESNADKLKREQAVLDQQLATGIGFWTSVFLVMAAVMVFMATYIYMKLFSKRL